MQVVANGYSHSVVVESHGDGFSVTVVTRKNGEVSTPERRHTVAHRFRTAAGAEAAGHLYVREQFQSR